MSEITNEITNEIKKRRTFAIISHPDAGFTEEPLTRQEVSRERQQQSMQYQTGWRLRRKEVFL